MSVFQRLLIFVSFFCIIGAENITFKNVTYNYYFISPRKFEKFIESATNLKDVLPKSKYYRTIEFTKQNIPILYEGCVKDSFEIEGLVINECGLTDIQPGAFQWVPLLMRLQFRGNKLTTIKEGAFNDLLVTNIDLSQNEISSIEEEAFDDMRNLEVLNLNDNKIAKWNPNWFKSSYKVTTLSFAYNLIEELPKESFKNIGIVRKGATERAAPYLYFDHNKIKTLHPETFKGLKNVSAFRVGSNLIEKLPIKLFENVLLDKLNISNNKFTCFEDMVDVFKAKEIDVDDNPLECKCVEEIRKLPTLEDRYIHYANVEKNCPIPASKRFHHKH